MPRHDRTRAVPRRAACWPSNRTLRWIIDKHPLLLAQLEPIFGAKIACEMVVASIMRMPI